MGDEIFKARILPALMTPVFFVAAFSVIYLVNGNISKWAWLICLFPLMLTISKLNKKLVVVNDTLRYKRLFKTKEVPLNKVSEIVLAEVRSGDREDTSRKMVFNALDESRRIYLSFPSYLLSKKTAERFKNAVTAVNPNIKMDF